MIDINTILTNALTAAVQTATAPLIQRLDALEAAQAAPKPDPLAVSIDAALTRALNQEWFWDRINKFIAEVLTVEQMTLPALVADAVQDYDLRPKVEVVLADYNMSSLITEALANYDFKEKIDEALSGISYGKFGDIVDDRLKDMRFRLE